MATGGLCTGIFVLLVNICATPAGLDGLWSLAYSLGEYLGKSLWVTQRRDLGDLGIEPELNKNFALKTCFSFEAKFSEKNYDIPSA